MPSIHKVVEDVDAALIRFDRARSPRSNAGVSAGNWAAEADQVAVGVGDGELA